MYVPGHTVADKVRWLVFGVIMLFAALLLLTILSPPADMSASAASATAGASEPEETLLRHDSPNAVTSGMGQAATEFVRTIDGTEQSLNRTGRSLAGGIRTTAAAVTGTAAAGGKYAAHSLHGNVAVMTRGASNGFTLVGRGVSAGAAFTGRMAVSGAAAMVYAPVNMIGAAADSRLVSAVIRPADKTPVPVIGAGGPTLATAITGEPDAKPAAHAEPLPYPDELMASWPLHGDITTLFGVPHWPYQPTHTGIDISDGKRPGVTPIKPIKPGRVVNTVYSYGGLGNHVVVDHGGGVTSLYGHLASISVQNGQTVDKNTVLGMEGSTGASTGTHLHLEIKVNGQLVDPLSYISGRP